MAAPTQGLISQLRARLFGARDPVADQLADIARQGSSTARVAHASALLLVLLFSAGSLVALGGDALTSITQEWRSGGVDIPAAIAVGVSTLLVLCMDVAMLYAASMLRLLATRQADRRERRIHVAVIAAVVLLEAATYGYMSWRYEAPATWEAWALIMARALAAPFLAVYLSMARPLPVTSRDILYRAELASGAGVIRDVIEVASDQGASLAEKMSLYGASATMSPHDRARLDGMIEAVQARVTQPYTRQLAPAAIVDAETDAAPTRLRVVSDPRRRRKRAAVRTASTEERARAVWAPEMSISDLAAAARISRSSASKFRRLMLAEAQQDLAV